MVDVNLFKSFTITQLAQQTQSAQPIIVIDCFGILDDERIKRYFELGYEMKELGLGYAKQIKDRVREEKEKMLAGLPLKMARAKFEEYIVSQGSRAALL